MDAYPNDRVLSHRRDNGSEPRLQIGPIPSGGAQPVRVKVALDHRPSRESNEVFPDHPSTVMPWLKPEEHEAFRLPHLGKRRSLYRPWIEHRCLESSTGKVCGQDLVAVNVTGKGRSELCWEIRTANDVVRMPECVVTGAYRGSLYALVKTKKAKVRLTLAPSSLVQDFREAFTDVLSNIGEPRQGHPRA
jgi:hypothetical protein